MTIRRILIFALIGLLFSAWALAAAEPEIVGVSAQVPKEVTSYLTGKLQVIESLIRTAQSPPGENVLPGGDFSAMGKPVLEGAAWRFGEQKGWYVKGDGPWSDPECSQGVKVAVVARPQPPDGTHCLEIDARNSKYPWVTVGYESWRLHPGERFTGSGWVMANQPGKSIKITLGYGRPYGPTFHASNKWTHHQQTFHIARDLTPRGVGFSLQVQKGAIYWLNGMKLVRGDYLPEDTRKDAEKTLGTARELIQKGQYVQAHSLLGSWQIAEAEKAAREVLVRIPWLVAGPYNSPQGRGFDQLFPPEKSPGGPLGPEFIGAEGKPQPWLYAYGYSEGGDPSVVDLSLYYEKKDWVVAYAATRPVTDAPTKCQLALKASGSLRVWLNGKQIYSQAGAPSLQHQPALIPITLNKGSNFLFLKSVHTTGRHVFSVSFVDESGNPVPTIRCDPPLGTG